MDRTCEVCGKSYDDASSYTYCPHDRFLSEADQAQKDLAMSLIGKPIRFNHQKDKGPDLFITSVGVTGMVTIDALPGEFAPHLFAIVDAG